MWRASVAGFLLAVTGLTAAFAQPDNAARVVRVQTLDVSDNLYLLSGGGGNTLALALDTGVVLVDAKLNGWGTAMMDALSAITDKPVTTIINTHAHADHTGANPEFPQVVQIVAHDNARRHLEATGAFAGDRRRFLPGRTVIDRLTLLDGRDQIDLHYFGRGHTDGDIVVVFPAKRVAHVGDLFPSKAAPFIDVSQGGSGVDYPATLARAAAALEGVTRIVTGHGAPPPGSMAVRGLPTVKDLVEYADFNRDFLAAVREAINAGKTAAEAAGSIQMPERYNGYDMARAPANVEAIYRELQR
jgi:glyoxylase-like metal-dependent hydrolase (beta-lactamase superfamily II)